MEDHEAAPNSSPKGEQHTMDEWAAGPDLRRLQTGSTGPSVLDNIPPSLVRRVSGSELALFERKRVEAKITAIWE